MIDQAVARELELFEQALSAGKRRGAYEATLAAWRACRAPELADLVTGAAKAFAPQAPLIEKKQAAFVEAWLTRARQREPYESRWLLEQLDGLVRAHKGSIVASCLDELTATKDDPSLPLLACEMAAIPGGTVNFGSWGKVLTRLFKLIDNAGDPRAVAALEALAKEVAVDRAAGEAGIRTYSTNEELALRIPRALSALAKRTAVALEPATVERCRRARAMLDAPLPPPVDESVSPTASDTLFAAVLADLDDAEARAVWADALQQNGDPRGELIALQLAAKDNPKAESKAKKLVTKHWREWLGPIAPAIVASSLELDGGLLVACTTDVRRKGASDAVFSHANWGTIRRIKFQAFGRLSAPMQWLEEALGVPESGLEDLATITLPRLRTLEVKPGPNGAYDDGMLGGKPKSRGMKALARATGLPALRTLSLRLLAREYEGRFISRRPEHYAWVFAAPIAAKLEQLAVASDWLEWDAVVLADWLAQCRVAPNLARLDVLGASTLLVDLRAGEATIDLGNNTRGAQQPWLENHLSTGERLIRSTGLRWRAP